nr:thermonuclease family protein [Metabacillus mangrovi]
MVVRVISGDTVEVLGEKGKETVRLLLADTPSDPSQDSMFGYQAAAFTKMSIDGQMVFLERGEGYIEGQKPTLGYIWLKQSDPVNFNKLLLSSGYARMVPSERNPKYETEFRKAEAEAKLAKRGIWEMEGYVTEEGFDSSVVE